MCTAALLGALMAGGATLSAPASAQSGGFSEGLWDGYLGMEADYTFDTDEGPVPTTYVATGLFGGATTAGNFTGDWSVRVDTRIDAGGTTADSKATAVGTFNGPTTGVDLDLDSVTATEPTIGLTVTFTAAELPGATGGRLEVVSATCNRVQGTWQIDFPDQALVGEFTAFRLGFADDESAAADRRENQAELLEFGHEILTAIRNREIVLSDIRFLLSEMEGSLQAPGTGECGGGSDRSFRSASSELIDSILFELAGSADELNTRTLIELVLMGYRSGSFLDDPAAESFWLGEYERAVSAALEGTSIPVLGQFSAASRLLDRTEEVTRIDTRIEQLMMEEAADS